MPVVGVNVPLVAATVHVTEPGLIAWMETLTVTVSPVAMRGGWSTEVTAGPTAASTCASSGTRESSVAPSLVVDPSPSGWNVAPRIEHAQSPRTSPTVRDDDINLQPSRVVSSR